MNEFLPNIERKPSVCLGYPVVGLTSPVVLEFLEAILTVLARGTKELFRSAGRAIVGIYRFLEHQSREGANIYNRSQMNLDTRYARNWLYIRNSL